MWYLDDAEPELLRDISQLLQLMVFAPKETLDLPETLFIMRRGVAAKRGRPLVKGTISGTDFICDSEAEMDLVAAMALTCARGLTATPQTAGTTPWIVGTLASGAWSRLLAYVRGGGAPMSHLYVGAKPIGASRKPCRTRPAACSRRSWSAARRAPRRGDGDASAWPTASSNGSSTR